MFQRKKINNWFIRTFQHIKKFQVILVNFTSMYDLHDILEVQNDMIWDMHQNYKQYNKKWEWKILFLNSHVQVAIRAKQSFRIHFCWKYLISWGNKKRNKHYPAYLVSYSKTAALVFVIITDRPYKKLLYFWKSYFSLSIVYFIYSSHVNCMLYDFDIPKWLF